MSNWNAIKQGHNSDIIRLYGGLQSRTDGRSQVVSGNGNKRLTPRKSREEITELRAVVPEKVTAGGDVPAE